jgi:hypothetical protein
MTDTTMLRPDRQLTVVSRIWHVLIAIDVVAALVIQVVLILTGGPDPNTG